MPTHALEDTFAPKRFPQEQAMNRKRLYILIGCLSATLAGGALFVTIERRVSAQSSVGNWITYNGNYAGDRFSPLQEITTANVSNVQVLCTFDTHETTSFQTGPLAVDGILYFTTYTDTYAVDGATCQVKWMHNRPVADTPLVVNRGVAFDAGRLFRGT